MDNLVFLNSNELHEEPFTRSNVIAEHGGVQHHTVTKLIQTYRSDLEEFGKVRFKIEPVEIGGSQSEKIYELNEDQATLLITYMRNNPQVRQFKKNLVRAFRMMQNELNKRAVTRQVLKESRRTFTDAIREKLPEDKWAYKHFTDLDYKCVLGMTAKQFESKYNIPNGKLRDYLESDQLQQVGIIEAATKALLEAGYNYQEIKDILGRKFLEKKIG